MMPDTISEKVIALIAKTKKIAPETIALDANLEELKIDSLDGLNLFFEIEETFDLSIPDDKARTMQTVRQIVEEIELQLANKGSGGAGSSVHTQ